MKNNTPLKILSIPVDKGGCGWYRVRQPFASIKEYTDSTAHVIDRESDDPIEILEALCQSDILVIRQGGEGGVEPLKSAANEYAKEAGLKQGFHAKIVLDIDDNIELISPYSEHYGEYGTRNFCESNGTWIWKDGQTKDFDLAKNRQRIMNLMWGLHRADLITVTTEKLAEYARQFNNNVEIFPNVIDTNVWWKPNFVRPNSPLRIGWSGGHSHYEDWYTIKEPLNMLLRKYNFTLVMAGTGFTGLIDEDLRNNVEILPWVSFEAHSYRTALLNLDLAIIPLVESPFNSYKSAIKYLEFSSAGIPSVVANVQPYKQVVDSSRAFPYETPEEFHSVVEAAITNQRNREKIGQEAYDYVHRNWTTKIWAQKYVDTFRSIL